MINTDYTPLETDYELIDKEIRTIMRKFNSLPFINRTLFSCAGYGEATNSHTGEIIEEHADYCGAAYVFFVYEKSQEKQFRKFEKDLMALEVVHFTIQDDNGKYKKKCKVAYYMNYYAKGHTARNCNSETKKSSLCCMDKSRYTKTELKKAWKQIETLIDTYLGDE